MIFNHRFPGVTTGLTFKVFDLWSITISSKPNAFHGLRLDLVASNTSVAESFLKPSPSLRLLPSDLNFLFVSNFPFKRSWWDTLPSLTEALKEGWKEMFLTTWKGLHNFFPLMLTCVSHHFSNNASLTRSLPASCNELRHYLLSEFTSKVRWCSGESTRFPLMLPGLKSRRRHHMRLCLLLVLSFALSGFSPAATVFQFKFQFNQEW